MAASLAVSVLPVVLTSSGCDRQTQRPARVGIVLFGDSRQPQVEGFIRGMGEPGDNAARPVVYLVRNAHNDRRKLAGLVRALLDAKVDLLAAAGGLEADTMKTLASARDVPVVVLYVNSILQRGLVRSRRHPGWAVTGVDNLNAEISGKRVELLQDLIPDVRRILILYYPDIEPSRIGMETARAAAREHGLVVDARAVHSRADIARVMRGLRPGDVDAMLTVPTAPIDNALKDIILPQVRRLHLPLMTHSRSLAEKGALASYGAPFFGLGRQAARLARKVLQGVAPQNMPFETPKTFLYTINRTELTRLHLTLGPLAQTQVDEFITTHR
ncbi:MAG: ABC transporter substrate-binding protein [Gammaproteobacteria bacterium]